MYAAKAPIAHDDNVIPRFGLRHQALYQLLQVTGHPGRGLAGRHHRLQIPIQPRGLIPDSLIRLLRCRRQVGLVYTQAHGVGARLNHRHDALLPHLTDAELSAADKEGKTALHHAAEAGAVRAARRLLAETYVDEVAGLELARININAVDNSGRNARQSMARVGGQSCI